MLGYKAEVKQCISSELIWLYLFSVLSIIFIIFLYENKKWMIGWTLIYVICIVFYFIYKEKQFSTQKWIKVEAKVKSAKVIKCICFSIFMQRQDSNEVYRPNVEYIVKYNGKIIESTEYAVSYDDVDCNFNMSEQEALLLVKNMRREKFIVAYINPETYKCILTLEKSKGYGIPYTGLSIAGLMFLFLVYKAYTY
jgi:hypothetical protein